MLRLSQVQYLSAVGAMTSKGTSTRLAALAASPASLTIRLSLASSGGMSSRSGYCSNGLSFQMNLPSFQRTLTQLGSRSLASWLVAFWSLGSRLIRT